MPARALSLGVEPGSVIPGTRYRALSQLGACAGAVVYEVEHLGLGRRFAFRMLRADLARRADVVRRARADWQALARLRHPHIAWVTDAGVTARGLPYSVTEQLPGETLRQRLARRRSISVPEALGIARELASALAAAHAIRVLHGHVAPHNVFLTKEGGSKLCDFGNYEDGAAGSPPDLAADVYGLGLVLFEMVAGRSALAISRARRQLRGRRAAGPPPLAEVVPGVAGAVSEIVARLLSPDPNDRPTLAALIAEIGGLQCRYEGQVSTTQETAHYATRRMSCVVDPAPPESEVGIIVPLPSQTLEGIPWTVITAALADRPGFGGAPPTVALGAGADVPASLERALVLSSPPGLAKAVLRSLPPRSSPPLGLKVRLLVVMACALLTGFLVAFLARRSEADEAGEAAPGAAATQRLRAGSRGVAAPACRVVSTR